ESFTVTFASAGNYKLVCLLHNDQTGMIHVLPPGSALPHTQSFYDDTAKNQTRDLIDDTDGVRPRGVPDRDEVGTEAHNVVVTPGELKATGGGKQYLAIMRFLPSNITVHVGDTVEWTNIDPAVPHTITFGVEPGGTPPQASALQLGITLDADGARV